MNIASSLHHFTTSSFIQENQAVVDAFVHAMNRSLEYAQAHADEARKAVGRFTKVRPEVLAKLVLPEWSSNPNVPSIRLTAQLNERDGFIEKQPDLSAPIRVGRQRKG